MKFGFIMNTDYIYVVAYCLDIHDAKLIKLDPGCAHVSISILPENSIKVMKMFVAIDSIWEQQLSWFSIFKVFNLSAVYL